MDGKIDWELELAGLHTAVATADAVVAAFRNQFVDGTDEWNATIVKCQPRFYEYLFQAVVNSVQNALQLVTELEEKAVQEGRLDHA